MEGKKKDTDSGVFEMEQMGFDYKAAVYFGCVPGVYFGTSREDVSFNSAENSPTSSAAENQRNPAGASSTLLPTHHS